jgi:5-methylcytosine-specific restriction endonuclease McrA
MSRAERKTYQIAELKDYIYKRDGGICQHCGRQVPYPGQLAHLIPQTKSKIKRYGTHVIHHPGNLKLACSLRCNNALQVSNDPIAEKKIVQGIRLYMASLRGRNICI